MFVSVGSFVCRCAGVWVRLCVRLRVEFVCVYVRWCISVYMCICVFAYLHLFASSCMCMCSCVCVCL